MAGKNGNRESMEKGLSTKKKDRRPQCPECETPNPTSHGRSWRCKACGRVWVKEKGEVWVRGKDIGERPVCPECRTPNPLSHGTSWHCKNCGKRWEKVRRPQSTFMSPMELITAKVITA